MQNPDNLPSEGNADKKDANSFYMMFAGSALLLGSAFGLAAFFSVSLSDHLGMSVENTVIGIFAVLPLALFLWWFVSTPIPSVRAFRDSQIIFFANLGFKLTPIRIVMISLAAGISEELLFRGVMQTVLYSVLPFALAVILPNIIFGALHMRTILYAVIAGVVGIYLGVVFAITGSLLSVIVCHAVYDVIALDYTRHAIERLEQHESEQV